MTYNEFKDLVLEKAKENKDVLTKEAVIRLKQELEKAKTYYEDIGDLCEELNSKPVTTNAFIIPFLLGITKDYDTNIPTKYKQVKPGDSGGIDVDSDFSGEGRDLIISYLKEKYGDDCVTPVGTVSTLQMKVACKDLLRYASCSVADSNLFTSELDDEISFEENISKIMSGNTPAKSVYEQYHKILDLVPRFLGKARNVGKHAGGVVLTPKPIWNYCPVERSDETIVTAFPENGQNTVLDAIGLVKLDLLAISVLDTIKETIGLINEPLYLIVEDGIQKIVPRSYLKAAKERGEQVSVA